MNNINVSMMFGFAYKSNMVFSDEFINIIVENAIDERIAIREKRILRKLLKSKKTSTSETSKKTIVGRL